MVLCVAAWAVAAQLCTAAQTVPAAGEVKHVLVLYSNGRLLPANFDADRGIRGVFEAAPAGPFVLYDEFLDQPRFLGEPYNETFVTYLRVKYASRHIDLVLAAGASALTFTADHRDELFPDARIVYAGVEDPAEYGNRPPTPGVVAVRAGFRFLESSQGRRPVSFKATAAAYGSLRPCAIAH